MGGGIYIFSCQSKAVIKNLYLQCKSNYPNTNKNRKKDFSTTEGISIPETIRMKLKKNIMTYSAGELGYYSLPES